MSCLDPLQLPLFFKPCTDHQTSCLNREQRQREGAKTTVNSFPKDRDYRQEAMQASATSALSSTSKKLISKWYYVGRSSLCWCFQWFLTHLSCFSSIPFILSESTLAEKPLSNSGYSQPLSINPSSTSSSSSSSTVPVSPALQASTSTLLQDPTLLRQLLPALQATLQMNQGNVDMSKINEGNDYTVFPIGFCETMVVNSVVGTFKLHAFRMKRSNPSSLSKLNKLHSFVPGL